MIGIWVMLALFSGFAGIGCNSEGRPVASLGEGGSTPTDTRLEAFPDSALASVIRESMDASSLHAPEELRSISAAHRGISTLDGIENLQRLRSLDLSVNRIVSVQPLVSLDSLEFLDLSWNQVEDVLPLENLNRLKVLNLANNKVTDLAGVIHLPLLSSLDVSGNPLLESSSQVSLLTQLSDAGVSVSGGRFGEPQPPAEPDPVPPPVVEAPPLDHNTVVFVSKRGGEGPGIFRVSVGAEKPAVRRVLAMNGRVSSPTVSMNRKRIAFATYSPIAIFTVAADGTDLRPLIEGGLFPSWSPDGLDLAYQGFLEASRRPESAIFILQLASDQAVQVSDAAGRSSFTYPSWHPVERLLLVTSHESTPPAIYLLDPDSREMSFVTEGQEAVWSPDGTRMAFVRGGDVRIRDLQGEERQLTTYGNCYEPSWSPDGSQLVFSSTRLGNQDIYVINADGTAERRITNSTAFDYSPSWSPW